MFVVLDLHDFHGGERLSQVGLTVSEDLAARLGSNEPLVVLRALLEFSETLLVKAETRIEQLSNGAYTIGEDGAEG